MAYVPETAPRNRNGVVGDHVAYAPVRLAIEEMFDRPGKDARGSHAGRTSAKVASHGDLDLVRYRIGSDEHRRDLRDVGTERHRGLADEYPLQTAVFGVVDRRCDRVLAMMEAFEEGRGRGLCLSGYLARADAGPDPDAVLAFVRLVDVPPSYHQHVDQAFARHLDLWYDPADASWGRREPVHAVCVGFERICFSVHPVIRETTQVLVPEDPAHDIASPDEDAAYRARHLYRERGFDALGRMHHGVRPGFSSWLVGGEPHRVKMVEERLYAEFSTGRDVAAEAVEAASPPSPR